MIYTTKEKIEIVTDFEAETIKFKANLPYDKENEINGNGEGVWVEASTKDYTVAANNNGYLPVKILNDSVYYPSLKYGDLILIKFTNNEEQRPIAPLEELRHKYGEPISEKELIIIKRKVNIMNQLRILYPQASREDLEYVFNDIMNYADEQKNK